MSDWSLWRIKPKRTIELQLFLQQIKPIGRTAGVGKPKI